MGIEEPMEIGEKDNAWCYNTKGGKSFGMGLIINFFEKKYGYICFLSFLTISSSSSLSSDCSGFFFLRLYFFCFFFF